MCLELYSSAHRIEIPFEDEKIEFVGPKTIQGTYTILVRNCSDDPLEELFWLYPRSLFFNNPEAMKKLSAEELQRLSVSELTAGIAKNVTDITSELKKTVGYSSRADHGELQFFVPNPNEPQKNIPQIRGRWDPNTALNELEMPCEKDGEPIFTERHIWNLSALGFTMLVVKLSSPLPKGEAQWFSWRIKSEMVGLDIPHSVMGPHIYHQFASPIFVHRAVRESILTGISDFEVNDDEQVSQLPVFESLKDVFCLDPNTRQVNVQHHFLTLWPGDPAKVALQHWNVEGDLRMLSGSPDLAENGNGFKAPVFKWKSGTALEPAHHWQDHGFMLRVMFQYLPHPPR